MQFTYRHETTERRDQPLGDFLFSGDLARAACQQLDVSAGALLLDHLVSNRWHGETFEDWLLRQVREIVTQHVQTEDWQDGDGGCSGTRIRRSVEAIALSDEDRDWLLARFARHPEVLAVWEEANRQEHIRQIAA